MTKMMYSLSTGIPPTASSFLRRKPLPEQALHLVGQRLLCGSQPALQLIGDVRFLLGRVELAAHVAQVALQPRDALLLVRQLDLLRLQVAVQDVALTLDVDQLVLQFQQLLLQVFLRLLDFRRAHVAEHQQQHDRAEAAGDAVQERDAEDLGFAAFDSSCHESTASPSTGSGTSRRWHATRPRMRSARSDRLPSASG